MKEKIRFWKNIFEKAFLFNYCALSLKYIIETATNNKLKIKIMTTLEKFTVWIPTEFGLGCQTIKGKDFTDAFLRLGKKDKLKRGWIEDESGESITFHEILGIDL